MGAPYVAIIENRAEVIGEVQGALKPDPARPGFSEVQVRVTSSEAIEGWPNLFERDAGGRVTVYVPDALADRFRPGATVHFTAKKSGLGTAVAVP
jgi:hypothetical protein